MSEGASPFQRVDYATFCPDGKDLRADLNDFYQQRLTVFLEKRLSEKQMELKAVNEGNQKDVAAEADNSKALRERFESMNEIIRFYFQLYESHVQINTSLINNYQDYVFADAKTCPAGGKAAPKFSLNLFYALAEELSEGAAPFL